MNNLSVRVFFLLGVLLSLTIGSCDAQIFHKNPEKQLFAKTHRTKKELKIREPKSVLRAKKKQEANDRKLDKAYEKSVRRSQKRTVDIQTPEVQARMKQNKKDTAVRDKEKKKKARSNSKRAGEKYK